MQPTITREKFQEHEVIDTIDYCLNQAIEFNSEIPEYSLEIPGMSGINYRHFINNLLRALEEPRYLEIGTWKGSTLCAAIGGIEKVHAVAVDNYGYGGATEEEVNNNVNQVKTESANITVLNQDFKDFNFSAHGKFDVYLYDGGHTEEEHYDAIVRAVPALEDTAIIIIDDWNNHGGTVSHIKTGTYNGLRDAGLDVIYKFEVETGVNPPFPSPWHNGYGVFLVQKTK
jgi:predicted O-methyltransferase YrrM